LVACFKPLKQKVTYACNMRSHIYRVVSVQTEELVCDMYGCSQLLNNYMKDREQV